MSGNSDSPDFPSCSDFSRCSMCIFQLGKTFSRKFPVFM